ncbi:kinase-like domain-containing protein [Coprinopsis sp. MPI-PUGE-AT-0042]|nr:kinase-like domain-containing protein [Coprinopsis sp. MPI-PUGE-AT-0042]
MALAGHQSCFHYSQQRNSNGSTMVGYMKVNGKSREGLCRYTKTRLRNYTQKSRPTHLLNHPNIVTFLEGFKDEDNDNVYVTLELWPLGSLMDMLWPRRRLHARTPGYPSRPEVQQPLNRNIGDFGLAALIENPGERKKTISGTPNYIASVVSIGVILYILFEGQLPIQANEVKDVYNLIQGILAPDPSQRPILREIVDAQFFAQSPVPAFIPTSAHSALQTLSASLAAQATPTLDVCEGVSNWTWSLGAQRNCNSRQEMSLLVYTVIFGHKKTQVQRGTLRRIWVVQLANHTRLLHWVQAAMCLSHHLQLLPATSRRALRSRKRCSGRLLSLEVPWAISSLLSLARQLLLAGPTATRACAGSVRESPLMKKHQAAGGDRTGTGLRRPRLIGGSGEQRQKELEAQKGRVVAWMAPVGEEADELSDQLDLSEAEEAESQEYVLDAEGDDVQEEAPKRGYEPLELAAKPGEGGYGTAFGKVFRIPMRREGVPEERVFIVSWIDYCDQYGMGYALTDGSVGVYFNDDSSLVLSADKTHFDYITS